MIYLYAIAEGLTDLPVVGGIDGVPAERHVCEGIDAIVSEHGAPVDPTEDAVLAHAHVVEALVPLATALLPARFGLGFDDVSALEKVLRERAADLRVSLDRVRGQVELGLRVVGEQRDEAPAVSNGRAYLEARRAQVTAADRLAVELHEALAARASAATRKGQLGGRLVLSGAYLVDPGSVRAFREAVDELESEHSALTFALTGPWPPYSFAGVDET